MDGVQIQIRGQDFQMLSIASIRPYERNAKIHSEAQVEVLRRSLETLGFVRPLLVDREGHLLAGHGILLAAQAAGMQEVPCVLVEGLTEEQRRAYILADNKLAELSSWDESMLEVELPELETLGIDLTGLGFDALEDVDFEPFSGEGDGGGSQVADGTRFRVVLGPMMFDVPDPSHALYDMARKADEEAVRAMLEPRLRDLLAGGAG